MGRIAAGRTVPNPDADVEEYVPLPTDRVRGEGAFMLRIAGDSMTGDGIIDSDLVIVVPDREPREPEKTT